MKQKRFIFVIGSTETLEYFSLQMAAEYRQQGRDIFIWDMRHPLTSREDFEALPQKENSILITFNFLGLNGEGQFASNRAEAPFSFMEQEGAFLPETISVWDIYSIEKYCIIVDSPIYYYRQLSMGIRNLHMVCIDKTHMDYLEKWHPQIPVEGFLPLAGNFPMEPLWENNNRRRPGNMSDYQRIPIAKRPYDLVFIGNYVPPEAIEPSIAGADREYQNFMHEIVDFLIAHPNNTFEDTLERFLSENFDEEDRAGFPEASFHMIYVDLRVRNYYRGQVIAHLVNQGFKVYCCGADWDKLPVERPENLFYSGREVTTSVCLSLLEQGRISINVMPWFKKGAHDRIFSSMLAGCCVVSDSSEYLDEILEDGKNVCFYSLEQFADCAQASGERVARDFCMSTKDASPDKKYALLEQTICELLHNPERMQKIADAGYELAAKEHTWAERARTLLCWIKD